jgi:hypothetical protein
MLFEFEQTVYSLTRTFSYNQITSEAKTTPTTHERPPARGLGGGFGEGEEFFEFENFRGPAMV